MTQQSAQDQSSEPGAEHHGHQQLPAYVRKQTKQPQPLAREVLRELSTGGISPLFHLGVIVSILALIAVVGFASASLQTHAPSLTMYPSATIPLSQSQSVQVALPTATPIPTATMSSPTASALPLPTATATPRPAPTATPRPPAPATPCPGVNCNPWGYNFTPGNFIYTPPGDFCNYSYFTCIPSFWSRTNGYVVECQDGDFSHSGGVQGACSYHGGEWRPLYSH